MDPLTQSYPWYTPYQFAGNKPIIAIDLDGAEEKIVIHHMAKYDDGTYYVKSTEVTIDHNSRYITGDGKEKAITNVYAEYQGQTSLVGFREEDVVPGGMKPSAAYDYTDEKGSMRQKEKDDKAYAGSYWNIGKWWKITKRDLNAPDNAMVIQDVQALGNILASQAAAAAALKQAQAARTPPTQTANPPLASSQPNSLVKINKIEDDVMEFSATVGEHTIQGITNFAVKGEKLYLNQLHLQGASAGQVGRNTLWNLAKDLGKQYRVKEVIIQGGRRTTGKFKGQVPSPITIKVD